MRITQEDRVVLTLCDDVWQWRLEDSPEMASFCGLHQHDDRWDDISVEAYAWRQQKVQEFLSRANLINTKRLSEAHKFTLKLLIYHMETYLAGAKFKSYLMPFNYLDNPLINASRSVSYMKFEDESDLYTYISRLNSFAPTIKQTIGALRQGLKEGIVCFEAALRGCVEQLDSTIGKALEEFSLLSPTKRTFASIPDAVVDKVRQQALEITKLAILPALRELRDFLVQEYCPNLRPHEGIASLENGEEWYQSCLTYNLGLRMTPSEVQALGYKEVARIEKQIIELAKKENLPEKIPDISDAIAERQANFFNTSEDVLNYAKNLCSERLRPLLDAYFKTLPNMTMEIQSVPTYFGKAPIGFYFRGTVDGSRKGVYYINDQNYKLCYPYFLPALSLHEGEPGHHLQNDATMFNKHLPDFRRFGEDTKYYLAPCKFPCNTAYVEGWGMYCEALGEEMGAYLNNMELIGRNRMELFRAVRLVVDPGLHAFGWTEAMAVEYMLKHSMESEENIRQEVQRYIAVPAQACAYKVGEIKIWELRRKAEKSLGAKFDIKEFHACLMACGPMPLDLLEVVVDKFIDNGGRYVEERHF